MQTDMTVTPFTFKAWWEKKRSKAVECDLKAIKEDDWLVLELIRGVSDTMLQKRLLQEHQASLAQLVLIAEQWQAADSARAAFGSKSTEYVRQAAEYNRESTSLFGRPRTINTRLRKTGSRTGKRMTIGHPLTSARVVGPKETKCTTEINALLPTGNVTTATSKATSDGYVRNRRGRTMGHPRWSGSQRRTGEAPTPLP